MASNTDIEELPTYDERLDREVREMMREWTARGLPVERQFIKAQSLYLAGKLSRETASKLMGVVRYLDATGRIVLRERE